MTDEQKKLMPDDENLVSEDWSKVAPALNSEKQKLLFINESDGIYTQWQRRAGLWWAGQPLSAGDSVSSDQDQWIEFEAALHLAGAGLFNYTPKDFSNRLSRDFADHNEADDELEQPEVSVADGGFVGGENEDDDDAALDLQTVKKLSKESAEELCDALMLPKEIKESLFKENGVANVEKYLKDTYGESFKNAKKSFWEGEEKLGEMYKNFDAKGFGKAKRKEAAEGWEKFTTQGTDGFDSFLIASSQVADGIGNLAKKGKKLTKDLDQALEKRVDQIKQFDRQFMSEEMDSFAKSADRETAYEAGTTARLNPSKGAKKAAAKPKPVKKPNAHASRMAGTLAKQQSLSNQLQRKVAQQTIDKAIVPAAKTLFENVGNKAGSLAAGNNVWGTITWGGKKIVDGFKWLWKKVRELACHLAKKLDRNVKNPYRLNRQYAKEFTEQKRKEIKHWWKLLPLELNLRALTNKDDLDAPALGEVWYNLGMVLVWKGTLGYEVIESYKQGQQALERAELIFKDNHQVQVAFMAQAQNLSPQGRRQEAQRHKFFQKMNEKILTHLEKPLGSRQYNSLVGLERELREKIADCENQLRQYRKQRRELEAKLKGGNTGKDDERGLPPDLRVFMTAVKESFLPEHISGGGLHGSNDAEKKRSKKLWEKLLERAKETQAELKFIDRMIFDLEQKVVLSKKRMDKELSTKWEDLAWEERTKFWENKTDPHKDKMVKEIGQLGFARFIRENYTNQWYEWKEKVKQKRSALTGNSYRYGWNGVYYGRCSYKEIQEKRLREEEEKFFLETEREQAAYEKSQAEGSNVIPDVFQDKMPPSLKGLQEMKETDPLDTFYTADWDLEIEEFRDLETVITKENEDDEDDDEKLAEGDTDVRNLQLPLKEYRARGLTTVVKLKLVKKPLWFEFFMMLLYCLFIILVGSVLAVFTGGAAAALGVALIAHGVMTIIKVFKACIIDKDFDLAKFMIDEAIALATIAITAPLAPCAGAAQIAVEGGKAVGKQIAVELAKEVASFALDQGLQALMKHVVGPEIIKSARKKIEGQLSPKLIAHEPAKALLAMDAVEGDKNYEHMIVSAVSEDFAKDSAAAASASGPVASLIKGDFKLGFMSDGGGEEISQEAADSYVFEHLGEKMQTEVVESVEPTAKELKAQSQGGLPGLTDEEKRDRDYYLHKKQWDIEGGLRIHWRVTQWNGGNGSRDKKDTERGLQEAGTQALGVAKQIAQKLGKGGKVMDAIDKAIKLSQTAAIMTRMFVTVEKRIFLAVGNAYKKLNAVVKHYKNKIARIKAQLAAKRKAARTSRDAEDEPEEEQNSAEKTAMEDAQLLLREHRYAEKMLSSEPAKLQTVAYKVSAAVAKHIADVAGGAIKFVGQMINQKLASKFGERAIPGLRQFMDRQNNIYAKYAQESFDLRKAKRKMIKQQGSEQTRINSLKANPQPHSKALTQKIQAAEKQLNSVKQTLNKITQAESTRTADEKSGATLKKMNAEYVLINTEKGARRLYADGAAEYEGDPNINGTPDSEDGPGEPGIVAEANSKYQSFRERRAANRRDQLEQDLEKADSAAAKQKIQAKLDKMDKKAAAKQASANLATAKKAEADKTKKAKEMEDVEAVEKQRAKNVAEGRDADEGSMKTRRAVDKMIKQQFGRSVMIRRRIGMFLARILPKKLGNWVKKKVDKNDQRRDRIKNNLVRKHAQKVEKGDRASQQDERIAVQETIQSELEAVHGPGVATETKTFTIKGCGCEKRMAEIQLAARNKDMVKLKELGAELQGVYRLGPGKAGEPGAKVFEMPVLHIEYETGHGHIIAVGVEAAKTGNNSCGQDAMYASLPSSFKERITSRQIQDKTTARVIETQFMRAGVNAYRYKSGLTYKAAGAYFREVKDPEKFLAHVPRGLMEINEQNQDEEEERQKALADLVLSLQQSAEAMDATDEEKRALGEDIRKLRDAGVSASDKEAALQNAQDKIVASYAFSRENFEELESTLKQKEAELKAVKDEKCSVEKLSEKERKEQKQLDSFALVTAKAKRDREQKVREKEFEKDKKARKAALKKEVEKLSKKKVEAEKTKKQRERLGKLMEATQQHEFRMKKNGRTLTDVKPDYGVRTELHENPDNTQGPASFRKHVSDLNVRELNKSERHHAGYHGDEECGAAKASREQFINDTKDAGKGGNTTFSQNPLTFWVATPDGRTVEVEAHPVMSAVTEHNEKSLSYSLNHFSGHGNSEGHTSGRVKKVSGVDEKGNPYEREPTDTEKNVFRMKLTACTKVKRLATTGLITHTPVQEGMHFDEGVEACGAQKSRRVAGAMISSVKEEPGMKFYTEVSANGNRMTQIYSTGEDGYLIGDGKNVREIAPAFSSNFQRYRDTMNNSGQTPYHYDHAYDAQSGAKTSCKEQAEAIPLAAKTVHDLEAFAKSKGRTVSDKGEKINVEMHCSQHSCVNWASEATGTNFALQQELRKQWNNSALLKHVYGEYEMPQEGRRNSQRSSVTMRMDYTPNAMQGTLGLAAASMGVHTSIPSTHNTPTVNKANSTFRDRRQPNFVQNIVVNSNLMGANLHQSWDDEKPAGWHTCGRQTLKGEVRGTDGLPTGYGVLSRQEVSTSINPTDISGKAAASAFAQAAPLGIEKRRVYNSQKKAQTADARQVSMEQAIELHKAQLGVLAEHDNAKNNLLRTNVKNVPSELDKMDGVD